MTKTRLWVFLSALVLISSSNATAGTVTSLFLGWEGIGAVDSTRLDILGTDPRFDHTNSASWSGTTGLPLLTYLQQFDSVLVWTNSSPDPEIGNLLADYADAGGRVVLATFWGQHASGTSLGRIGDTGYNPFVNPVSGAYESATLGVYDSSNPLFQGVSSLIVSKYRGDYGPGLDAGATLAGSWSDGKPLAGYNAAGTVYNITLFPNMGYGHASGDYQQLFRNALAAEAAGPAPVPEPGTMSVLGIGLLVIGAVSRRVQSSSNK